MSDRGRTRRFDPIALLAVLTCLSFVVGLRDVALGPLAPMAVAPPPPGDESAREGQLEVRVSGERGALAGATVRLLWEWDRRYHLAARAMTDASGRVALERLPVGVTWVLAEAPGYARASAQVVVASEPRLLELELAPPHPLSVRVIDEQGAPLDEATVLVTAADPLPYGALTDARGVARFARLGPSPWTVKASAPGHESITRSGVSSDLTIELRRLGSLEIAVELPSGAPAPGAAVLITGTSLWPARQAEADARGATRISGLLAGSYDLRATLGDYVSPTLIGFELARGADERLTLRLVAGRRVRIVVTDGEEEDALVVPAADVVLAESGLSSFPIRGRTGADGSVTLGPIAPGPATVAARAADFVSTSGAPVPDKLEGPVRVALLRGGTLRGEVVDSRDRPVDGASIEVIGTDTRGLPIAETPWLHAFRRTHFEWALAGPVPLIPAGELGVMPGPVPPIPPPGAAIVPGAAAVALALPADAEPAAAPLDPWVTRWDGSFVARPVTPGRLRALVRHPDYVEAVSEVVAMAPGGEAKVKVVMLAGGSIEGRVVDERGRPVAGARVDLTALRGTLERTTQSASDGSFAFAAVPADVLLALARPEEPGRIVLRKALSVKEGERARVELTLPPARESVRVVVTADREPVDAAQVTLLSLDPSAPLRQTLFTGSDGVVTIGDARGLDVRIVVEAPGFTQAVLRQEQAPEEVLLALVRGVIVTGRVTAVRGRQYLSGASVTILSEGRRVAALTDGEGGFTLREVAPGSARVQVSHPKYATRELDVVIAGTGRDDRPFELEPIDLPDPASVEGEVVDASGKPVAGARVSSGIVPAYLPAGALPEGMAVTDRKGRFVLLGVTPGKLDLEAYAPEIGRGRVRGVEVGSGRPASGIKIRLTEPADADPMAAASLAVTLGERGGEVVLVHVSSSSEAERAGLRPGDRLTLVDGYEVRSMREARERLSGPAGSDVIVELERDGERLKLRIAREPVRR
jgi:hypothetical protein